MLKVSTTFSLRAFCSSSFVIERSVVRKQIIVHICGWIMPEPFVIPPRWTFFPPIVNSSANSLFVVSVVMMALLAAVAAASLASSFGTISEIAFFIFSIGSCRPMIPVDASSTESAEIT